VSPPRVCHIKARLGRMLAAHGYEPLKAQTVQAQKRSRSTGRKPGRLTQIPLNAGSSPTRRDRRRTHRRGLRLPVPRRLPIVRPGTLRAPKEPRSPRVLSASR
jgi:hypothetical protein